MRLQFTKMHGLGNDFVIINNLDLQHQFSATEISFIADRKFGVGCDQVLVVDKATDNESDFFYRIYNSDGSSAGQCGNGARCFIRYVIDKQLTTKKHIQLQTRERIISGEMLDSDLIKVNMGIPEFAPVKIPLCAEQANYYQVEIDGKNVEFVALSMGNPHAIIQLDQVELLADDEHLEQIAQFLQTSALFPESVNVSFIYKVDDSLLKMRTYERGCGFTLACGSGACASAAAAIKSGLTKAEVKLIMPGGILQIIWDGGDLYMVGSATLVFAGEIEL